MLVPFRHWWSTASARTMCLVERSAFPHYYIFFGWQTPEHMSVISCSSKQDRHSCIEWTGLPQALFFGLLYWQFSKCASPHIFNSRLMDRLVFIKGTHAIIKASFTAASRRLLKLIVAATKHARDTPREVLEGGIKIFLCRAEVFIRVLAAGVLWCVKP